MVTTRLLRAVKDAGVGLSSSEIAEWKEAVAWAVTAGALRLGDYNAKLIDSISLAWCATPFYPLQPDEYTHGERQLTWLDADVFRLKESVLKYFIKLPHGHPIMANYAQGQVTGVFALTAPGQYSADVTTTFASLFPAGIDHRITKIYAVVSASEENWSQDVLRIGTLLSGERGFISGVDRITLSWVEGYDIQDFCDYGILGALSVPLIDAASSASTVIENTGNTRCVIIGVGDNCRCALYCSRVQTGEVISIRAVSGAGTNDLAYLELDTGDDVIVPDLLALRGKEEGAEVHYIYGETDCVLSDEYGNGLLGTYTENFN